MCLTMPARVLAVDDGFATVEGAGVRRRASTLLEPEVAVGDWVLVSGGTIVRRLDEEQALEMAAAFETVNAPEDDAAEEPTADGAA